MFGRRKPRTRYQQIVSWLWPRRGIGPAARYFQKRIMRIKGSPHAIALGFAAGVGVSFLPLPGLHFVLGGVAAFAMRGSIIASAFGTAIGNPWTFPFIWLAGNRMGHWLGVGNGGEMAADSVGRNFALVVEDVMTGRISEALAAGWRVLGPTMVGGAFLGAVAGLAIYLIVRKAVAAYQAGRRAKIAAGRARMRQAAKLSAAPGE